MKTTASTIASPIFILCFLTSTLIFANPGGNNGNEGQKTDKSSESVNGKMSTDVLLVKGQVKNLSEVMPYAEVTLYADNEAIDHMKTDHAGKFLLSLQNDGYYVVEVNSADHMPKRFVINTAMDKTPSKTHEFQFELMLIPEVLMQNLDPDLLDFPYALISYDKKSRGFDYDENYSNAQFVNESTLLFQAKLIYELKKEMGATSKKAVLN